MRDGLIHERCIISYWTLCISEAYNSTFHTLQINVNKKKAMLEISV